METLPRTLTAQRKLLAERLHHPLNIDVEFRDVRLGATPGLLIWIDGIIAVERLETHILKVLGEITDPAPAAVAARLPVPRQEFVTELPRLLQGIFAGSTALLAEGWNEALLLDTVAMPEQPGRAMSPDRLQDIFGRDARGNLALVRRRLRDPALIARRLALKRPRSGPTALVYLEGRAHPTLVRALRIWAYSHLGEEAAQRGLVPGLRPVLGLVPRFSSERWPDKAAELITNGHVLILIDGSVHGFVAPVTAAADLLSASDSRVQYPLRRWLVRLRLLFYYLVMMLPGAVIALLNYHQEMIPTSFLLAVASARENAAFGVFLEVLLLEFLVDLGREASFRLEVALPIGSAMVSTLLLVILAVLAGFVGPIPAMAAAVGAIISAALPGYVGGFLFRLWRYHMILAAVFFGLFGMATMLTLFIMLVTYSRPWGVPLVGAGGWSLTAPEADAASGAQRKGRRKTDGTPGPLVR